MNVTGVQQLLSELHSMADQAAGGATQAGQETGSFAGLLSQTLDKVNQGQVQTENMQQKFALGTGEVDVQDVMMSMQKASLSFQTLVQVRNKLVTAYQEVMNMQV